MKIKNLLLSLFGGLIILLGFSSFCSAKFFVFENVYINGYGASSGTILLSGVSLTGDLKYWVYSSFGANKFAVGRGCGDKVSSKWSLTPGGYGTGILIAPNCSSSTTYTSFGIYTTNSSFDYNTPVSFILVDAPIDGDISCPECPTCPSQYTSEECQTEYGLVSSGVLNSCQLDLNSCQSSLSGWNNTLDNCSNNLLSCQSSLSSCIAGNCPLDDGDVQWSSLFINNIQHIGAPLININIPEEISWDYTSSTGSFDLDVEGYNVDADYIEGVINIQNSKPTTEDFNKIITQVIPLFVPGLVIILFIYFVFKFLKKIF